MTWTVVKVALTALLGFVALGGAASGMNYYASGESSDAADGRSPQSARGTIGAADALLGAVAGSPVTGWPRTGPERRLTLEQWQAEREWADPEARTDLARLPGGQGTDPSELFINDTDEPKTIELWGLWRDLRGNEVTRSLTLQPFTSAVLIGDERE